MLDGDAYLSRLSMHHLIYSSTATHPFSDQELQDLLRYARDNNGQQGLTGILLYHDGHFMQLLEGEPAAVHALYQRITQDTRHTGVIKLADKAVESRSFADWSMAFRALDYEQYAQVRGYQLPETANLAPEGLSAADTMLLEIMRTFMLRNDPEQ